MSDSRTYGLTFKEVLLIDSTTIRLFSDVLKGVGRNPKGDGKKKGGLKVHMLIDAVQSVGRFIKITAAKVHDKNFLKSLELISHSMVVFDKAYNYYHQFALWTQNQVYFVSRLNTNAVYTVVEVTRRHYRKKGIAKVLSDKIIEMEYHPEDEIGKRQTKITKKLRLRKVCYQDECNRYYEFLTNSFEITAEEVAFLYKKRWGIEILFFKDAKQHLQLGKCQCNNFDSQIGAATLTMMQYIMLLLYKQMHFGQSLGSIFDLLSSQAQEENITRYLMDIFWEIVNGLGEVLKIDCMELFEEMIRDNQRAEEIMRLFSPVFEKKPAA